MAWERVAVAAATALGFAVLLLLGLWKADTEGLGFWHFIRDPRKGRYVLWFGAVIILVFLTALMFLPEV